LEESMGVPRRVWTPSKKWGSNFLGWGPDPPGYAPGRE